jgi:hypothetical protein
MARRSTAERSAAWQMVSLSKLSSGGINGGWS